MAQMVSVSRVEELRVETDRPDKRFPGPHTKASIELALDGGALRLTPGEALRLRSQLDAALDELQADPPHYWPQAQIAAAEQASADSATA